MKKKSISSLKSYSVNEIANEWGIDYQVFKMKIYLIGVIKDYCKNHSITQKKLASMVLGLTQDRISKIFSGQPGHMTIDMLVKILTALEHKIEIKAKAA
jgi:predicted XRE-type DNA-binding protein